MVRNIFKIMVRTAKKWILPSPLFFSFRPFINKISYFYIIIMYYLLFYYIGFSIKKNWIFYSPSFSYSNGLANDIQIETIPSLLWNILPCQYYSSTLVRWYDWYEWWNDIFLWRIYILFLTDQTKIFILGKACC